MAHSRVRVKVAAGAEGVEKICQVAEARTIATTAAASTASVDCTFAICVAIPTAAVATASAVRLYRDRTTSNTFIGVRPSGVRARIAARPSCIELACALHCGCRAVTGGTAHCRSAAETTTGIGVSHVNVATNLWTHHRVAQSCGAPEHSMVSHPKAVSIATPTAPDAHGRSVRSTDGSLHLLPRQSKRHTHHQQVVSQKLCSK
eukprot:COSAG04_NODE_480_length_13676_cov_4.040657_3_plen_204_part_00